ncbi:Syntaxin ufe1 [Pseudocercospora fuligena]|uniref:Syntaxin ufe1 n=1 Tax=Pseudocercospora fuligena TaxID=685502 RepID=A0A8H6RWA0_9PEZI|nr:Syntaxin ufe1 [Pseudocercospora fuligena]
MTEITADFNVCLKEKGASVVLKKEYDIHTINSFLQEAYAINTHITDLIRDLRAKRPAYLSAAQPSRRRQAASDDNRARPLTDRERDAFDAETKRLLKQLSGAITALKQVEDARNEAADAIALRKRARGGLGALGRWAAGGAVTAKSPEEEIEEAARKTVAAARESVILYLQTKLKDASTIQQEMMDARLSRAEEKAKSILAKSTVGASIQHALDEEPAGVSKRRQYSGDLDREATQPSTTEQLTQEQLQMFQEENHELLKHYEDQLDQVRTAERSILEISELHTTLHANLSQQAEHIEQLVQDSYLTTENLGKGNKELKRASERRSTAQALFWSSAAFCSFLIVWDLFV